ncbi:MAG: Holliday junction resolvase RuvX [Rickettsiales bacterium]
MLIENQEEFTKNLPKEGRILGLDVGQTTIGMALSDVRRTIATPHSTIERGKFSKDVEKLSLVISTHKICALVIGYPINMDGSKGARAQSTITFVSNISKKISLPMLLWDERFSTMAVEKMMIEADMSRQRRAELVDKLAASYMLQGYLDNARNTK